MFTRPYATAVCALAVLAAGCGPRAASPSSSDTTHIVRVEQSTSTFYPRNPGCTFDGVPGATADIRQMHNAKSISAQCFAPEAQAEVAAGVSRTFYTANPGCTIDGVEGSKAGTEQILNAKVIADACYAEPTARGMHTTNSEN